MKCGIALTLLKYVTDYNNNFISKENNILKLGNVLLNYHKIDTKVNILKSILKE